MTDPDPRTSDHIPQVHGSTAVPAGADTEPTAAEEAAAEAK